MHFKARDGHNSVWRQRDQFTAERISDGPFPSNGQGSDHGWGSHHLIMGGAVNGRRTYGVVSHAGPSTGLTTPARVAEFQPRPLINILARFATWFGVDKQQSDNGFFRT